MLDPILFFLRTDKKNKQTKNILYKCILANGSVIREHVAHSFSLYIAVSHMAHVLVYYTLLVVIIICIMFVKLRKCWRM